jgi:hypothetical protein
MYSGSSFNLALLDIEKLNWRLQLAVAAIPAITLVFLTYACPGEHNVKMTYWLSLNQLTNFRVTQISHQEMSMASRL